MGPFNPARSHSSIYSFPDHLLDALGGVHGWVPGRVQRDDSYWQEAHVLMRDRRVYQHLWLHESSEERLNNCLDLGKGMGGLETGWESGAWADPALVWGAACAGTGVQEVLKPLVAAVWGSSSGAVRWGRRRGGDQGREGLATWQPLIAGLKSTVWSTAETGFLPAASWI